MNPDAIILMVVSIVLVWGGLVASAVALRTMSAPNYRDNDEETVEAANGNDTV